MVNEKNSKIRQSLPDIDKNETPPFSSIDRVVHAIHDRIFPLLINHRDVVLLDFPNHANIGDSIIWLGTLQILKEVIGCNIHFVSTGDDFSIQRFRKVVAKKNFTILLLGGGNFGDIWIHHQNFRNKIIQEFPDKRIIQLPQSIYFSSYEKEKLSMRLAADHSDFYLLVRDKKSYEIGLRYLPKTRIFLCPDMAFCIDIRKYITTQIQPTNPIKFLLRSDIEAISCKQKEEKNRNGNDWVFKEDGMIFDIGRCMRIVDKHFIRIAQIFDLTLRQPYYRKIATLRLKRGINLLQQGKRAITDRLHGHILCVLLGMEHIAIDNSYGKVHSFINAWTKNIQGVHMANSIDEACRLARRYGWV